jgi:integrase/recombinase XerD
MKNKKPELAVVKSRTEISNNFVVDQELAKKFQQAKKPKIQVEDFIQDFLAQFISKATVRSYLKDLDFFFSFLKSGGEIIQHPREIGSHHFQIYRDHMMSIGLASATINRRLVCIRSFMKWALATQLIEFNPLDAVKLPRVETESPTLAFDDQEVVAMINAPDVSQKLGNTHRLVMVMLFSLGLRRSELANIKLKDFYQERGHFVLKIIGKGRKERHLPINNEVYYEITEYLNRLKTFGIDLMPDDYLIQTQPKEKNQVINKQPIDGSTIFRIIQTYKKMLGINKRVSPHSCRATVISHLLDTQKTPIRDVAIFAGHSKITTTERYDKRRQGLDDSAAYAVNYGRKKKSA